jgi:hypothetical protein
MNPLNKIFPMWKDQPNIDYYKEIMDDYRLEQLRAHRQQQIKTRAKWILTIRIVTTLVLIFAEFRLYQVGHGFNPMMIFFAFLVMLQFFYIFWMDIPDIRKK